MHSPSDPPAVRLDRLPCVALATSVPSTNLPSHEHGLRLTAPTIEAAGAGRGQGQGRGGGRLERGWVGERVKVATGDDDLWRGQRKVAELLYCEMPSERLRGVVAGKDGDAAGAGTGTGTGMGGGERGRMAGPAPGGGQLQLHVPCGGTAIPDGGGECDPRASRR